MTMNFTCTSKVILLLLAWLFQLDSLSANLSQEYQHPIHPEELRIYYEENVQAMEQKASSQEIPTQLHIGLFTSSTVQTGETLEWAQEKMVNECVRDLIQRENVLILDIGCGFGGPLLWVLNAYPHVKVHGVDIHDSCIKKAEALLKEKTHQDRFKILKMDAHAMTFADETYDSVFAIESLDHMNQPLVFREIYRVLKNKGLFSFCSFCKKKELSQADEAFLLSTEFLTLWHQDEYENMLRNIGYEKIEIVDLTERIHPNFQTFYPEEVEFRALLDQKKIGYVKVKAVAKKG